MRRVWSVWADGVLRNSFELGELFDNKTTRRHYTISSVRNANNWSGAVWITPIAGAYITDSYIGCFWTFTASSLIYVLVFLQSLLLSFIMSDKFRFKLAKLYSNAFATFKKKIKVIYAVTLYNENSYTIYSFLFFTLKVYKFNLSQIFYDTGCSWIFILTISKDLFSLNNGMFLIFLPYILYLLQEKIVWFRHDKVLEMCVFVEFWTYDPIRSVNIYSYL